MRLRTRPLRRQVALHLRREATEALPEDAREALVAALADLLLEALAGEQSEEANDGGENEEREDN
jgi:hypothetical protein